MFSLSNTFFCYFVDTNNCFHCLDYFIFSRKLRNETELLNDRCLSLVLLSENIFRTITDNIKYFLSVKNSYDKLHF